MFGRRAAPAEGASAAASGDPEAGAIHVPTSAASRAASRRAIDGDDGNMREPFAKAKRHAENERDGDGGRSDERVIVADGVGIGPCATTFPGSANGSDAVGIRVARFSVGTERRATDAPSILTGGVARGLQVGNFPKIRKIFGTLAAVECCVGGVAVVRDGTAGVASAEFTIAAQPRRKPCDFSGRNAKSREDRARPRLRRDESGPMAVGRRRTFLHGTPFDASIAAARRASGPWHATSGSKCPGHATVADALRESGNRENRFAFAVPATFGECRPLSDGGGDGAASRSVRPVRSDLSGRGCMRAWRRPMMRVPCPVRERRARVVRAPSPFRATCGSRA